jgi:ribonucleoside-diphosphate reductase alpha chain
VGKFPRPEILEGFTRKVKTGCGSLYVTINTDPKTGEPCELFVVMGKSGGCANATGESIGRLCSALLKLGASPDLLVRQLGGVYCHAVPRESKLLSCPSAVAHVIKEWRQSNEATEVGN